MTGQNILSCFVIDCLHHLLFYSSVCIFRTYCQSDYDPRQCRSSPDLLGDVSKQVMKTTTQNSELAS